MKKLNFLKYIFIVFVIGLAISASYLMKKQKDNDIVAIEEKKDESEQKLTTINTLRLAAISLDTINPIISQNKYLHDLSELIYEPMLTITEDYQIKACLAKEWINLSDTAYVLVLRDGVKFHNGEELTATDVKYTIEQIQNLGGSSIYYSNVEHIVNTEILSTYTIKITIDEKRPFFEYNFTFPIMSSIYYTDEDIQTSLKNNTAPGTGKYFVNNITGTEIELKKNSDWWGKSQDIEFNLDTILIKLYTSAGEAYNAFKMGSLDLMTTQGLNYEEYIGTIGYNVEEYEGREFDYLAFNCESKVLKNKEIRQAINYAIDKSNIIATVYENKYYVADFPLNNSNYLYNIQKVSSSFNQNKSKELLENAGWEMKGGIWQKTGDGSYTNARLNLVVNSENENRSKVADEIKKQLDDFGIAINVIKVNSSQYAKYLQNKNYDLILTGKIVGISPSLTGYVGESNLSEFREAEIEELLNEISELSDNKDELTKKYKRVLKMLEDEVPYVSLYFNRNTLIYTQDLKGKLAPNFYNPFYNIETWYRQY